MRALLIAVVVLLVAGLIALMVWGGGPGDNVIETASSVSGELRARGGPVGDYRIKPRFCRTGSRDRFGGASLYASSPAQGVRLQQGVVVVGYIDGGPDLGVRIMVPGRCRDPEDPYSCKRILLRARDCSRFEVATRQGRRLSPRAGTFAYSGHARLSCALADGAAIEADLSFKSCD